MNPRRPPLARQPGRRAPPGKWYEVKFRVLIDEGEGHTIEDFADNLIVQIQDEDTLPEAVDASWIGADVDDPEGGWYKVIVDVKVARGFTPKQFAENLRHQIQYEDSIPQATAAELFTWRPSPAPPRGNPGAFFMNV